MKRGAWKKNQLFKRLAKKSRMFSWIVGSDYLNWRVPYKPKENFKFVAGTERGRLTRRSSGVSSQPSRKEWLGAAPMGMTLRTKLRGLVEKERAGNIYVRKDGWNVTTKDFEEREKKEKGTT